MDSIKNIPFYTETSPVLNSLVVADIYEYNDLIVNCRLPEYSNSEAIIPTTEIKIKRGKALRNYIKKGQQVVAQVIRVDEEGRLDLSMKAVREDETKDVLEKYHKTLKVLQILGTATHYKLEETQELLGLVYTMSENYKSPYEFFEACLIGEEIAPTPEILSAIQMRMPIPSYTCEKEISIRFSEADGVKLVMNKLDELCSKGLQVYVIAPPKYRIVATANSLKKAQALLQPYQDNLVSVS